MDILRKIGMQFKKPRGVPGKIISDLMIIGNRSAYNSKMMGHFAFIWQVRTN